MPVEIFVILFIFLYFYFMCLFIYSFCFCAYGKVRFIMAQLLIQKNEDDFGNDILKLVVCA